MREYGVQIQCWDGFTEGRNNLFPYPLLSTIASRRGVVAIPKSVRAGRMGENIDVLRPPRPSRGQPPDSEYGRKIRGW
ncbi:hypothetical protein [Streptomyces sp. NPDC052114]|uniref:hypothetical protein n=1 Tax=unclassified Streptomyces TaxID=2593676 RepID=UPI0034227828